MSFILDAEHIPNEVWSTIFSYLDRKSLKCARLTCKIWFELIRADSKLSSHIILKECGLDNLHTKVKNSKWKWERWPVLKTIELEHEVKPKSTEDTLDLVNKMKFDRCPTL